MVVYNLATWVVGFILLPFYMLAPIVYLWVEGDLDYKEHLSEVQRKAEQDLVIDVKYISDTSTNGYKAAITSDLIG